MDLKAFSRAELALTGTAGLLVFSRVFGLSLVLPSFRGHYEGQFSVDPFWIGVAFSAYGLTMALMQLPNGVLSDKFGRRPMLWIASILFIGGSVMAATANTPSVLIAARLLQGAGAIASVAVAAVGETLPASRRTMGMALVGITAGTGFLAGMAVGPLLYPFIGMKGLFLLTAGIGALAAAPLGWIDMPNPARGSAGAASAPITRPVIALAMGGFAANYIMTTTLFVLPPLAGWIFAILMLVALLVMTEFSKTVDKRGWSWQPLVVGALGIGVAAILFTRLDGYGFWIGGALFFAFHAVLATVLPSQVSRIAGPSGGRGHGIQNVVAYSGTFAAGPIAGLLSTQPLTASLVAAGVGTVAAITMLAYLRSPQRSSVPPSEPASSQ